MFLLFVVVVQVLVILDFGNSIVKYFKVFLPGDVLSATHTQEQYGWGFILRTVTVLKVNMQRLLQDVAGSPFAFAALTLHHCDVSYKSIIRMAMCASAVSFRAI